MLRVTLLLFAALAWLLPLPAAADTPLTRALAEVSGKNWSAARRAVRNSDPLARDIIEWHRLRAGEGRPKEVLAFLEKHPDWPGLQLLRKRSEEAFADASRSQITRFFAYGDAQTAQGVLIQARSLERNGQKTAGEALVINAWRSMEIGPQSHAQFLDRYGRLLSKHHEARMDFVLWEGWENNTKRMMPLVNKGWQALATARRGLRKQERNVDALIANVPDALKSDPGLAYERFVWRARKNRDNSAIELMLAQSDAGQLGNPKEWSGRRRALAREKMRAGAYQTAYRIAASHGMLPSDGYAYSDCEWIAGYVALRFLNKPSLALQHFLRFEQSIDSPISRGRAGYWIGRAYEAMGDKPAAQNAYTGGGAYQTSFYGLLAAEKAGLAPNPALTGDERFGNWQQAPYTQSSVHKAATLLLKAGDLSLAERFWLHLAETQDRQTLGQMGTMAQELGAPHVAVMLGKQAAKSGIVLHGAYYPLHPLVNRRQPVPTELALAIARRESEFDPSVVSGAGARGLMQVMPGTAKLMAKAVGTAYSFNWLTAKPDYNVRLGTAYLAKMADEFDGNVILMAAGYNAGPGRPARWMQDRGDPRRRGVDMIDWIEHIPFTETRNYVMRVAESLPIYRARMGRNPHPVPFSKEISGSTMKARR